jgi:hypothetical protein
MICARKSRVTRKYCSPPLTWRRVNHTYGVDIYGRGMSVFYNRARDNEKCDTASQMPVCASTSAWRARVYLFENASEPRSLILRFI